MEDELSTCHGLPKLFSALKEPKPRRYVVLWLLSIGIAIAQLVSLLSTNIQIHINRSTTYQETISNEMLIPYPSITFCNGNPYSRKTLEDPLLDK
ncbi:hypothetical protein SNEBB_010901, partial [Seison nebaliae]